MTKTAFFRFEASPTMGAGHAIRSCVIADALTERGWDCQLVTSHQTYDFISHLNRFQRIEPEYFYLQQMPCHLFVIDGYDFDAHYQKHFRSSAKKIMVIDDLANRYHDCDILLDQAYKREPADYQPLVPPHCQICTGIDYVLLRREVTELRDKALSKRNQTTEIKRILIAMGGADQHNYTERALQLIKNAGFKGAIDIAIGFTALHGDSLQKGIATLPNVCKIHINANMPQLIYEADLAIGAAGSGVWERCALGLPQCVVQSADNQAFFLSKISDFVCPIDFKSDHFNRDFTNFLTTLNKDYQQHCHKITSLVDLMGTNRVISTIERNE